jgi:hypothetical protein
VLEYRAGRDVQFLAGNLGQLCRTARNNCFDGAPSSSYGPMCRHMPECPQPMRAKHSWTFKSRLRSRAFGWKGSHLACKRLKVAVTEIKKASRDPKTILVDLATSSGDPGRWFAAARDAGFLDLPLEFGNEGRTDPRTLSRASPDLLQKDARFSLQTGRLAIQRILEGYGYELTGADVIDACSHFMAAARTLGVASQARADMLALATKQSAAVFSDILIRQCSLDGPQGPEAREEEATSDRRTWTRQRPTRHSTADLSPGGWSPR